MATSTSEAATFDLGDPVHAAQVARNISQQQRPPEPTFVGRNKLVGLFDDDVMHDGDFAARFRNSTSLFGVFRQAATSLRNSAVDANIQESATGMTSASR